MNKLMIIDGNAILNRAFFALPPLTTRDGIPTNAVLGFLTMLFSVVNERKPTHLIVTFDAAKKNFRHELYSDYKGTRKGMADELRAQLPILKEILDQLEVDRLECEGYEADDLIGTLTKRAVQDGMAVEVISGDKDILQLVKDHVTVGITKRGTKDVLYYDRDLVKEDLGIYPEQVIEYKGLRGDTSDNIPGVKGIGEKTAVSMLEGNKTLEEVYENIETFTKRQQTLLTDEKDMAFLSRTLATINEDVPIDLSFDTMLHEGFQGEKARTILSRYELKSIMKQLNLDEVASVEEVVEEVNPPTNERFVKVVGEDLIERGGDGPVIGFNLQPAFLKGLEAKAFYDVSLEHYLLHPELDSTDPVQVVGAKVEDDDFFEKLWAKHVTFMKELKEKDLLHVYLDIELPLVPILTEMTREGFRVNTSTLDEIDQEITKRLTDLEKKIYELAGEEFNINSPKQLGVILFEKLGLPPIKKTKTGYSTNKDVLDRLLDRHEIIKEILDYRTVAKIKGTYIDGLRPMIKEDGKIHSTFQQTIAVTGRLSSTDPNLQNIPIRLEEGRQIRKMFIPSTSERVLLSFDYSQIELRILAHVSEDEHLIHAYNNGIDIHALTASKVFDIPLEEVTGDVRRDAKAVNFGIVYGISDFGLSNNIQITRSAAKDYIDKYFEEYPKIKEYMDKSVAFCKEHGYVKTLSGRIREIPEINAKNFNLRSFAERTAINTPIQGSAADLIKMSMIEVDRRMKAEKLKSKMILQVHDELIFDVEKDELETMKALVKDVMENIVTLKLPLEVSTDVGDTWYEV
ncbi:DNA polymerase I [Guggenheimella bovis]